MGFKVSFTLSCLRGHSTPTLAPEFPSFPKDLHQGTKAKGAQKISVSWGFSSAEEGQERRRRNHRILELLRVEKISEHQAPHTSSAHRGDSRKPGTFQEYKLNPSSRQANRWPSEPAEALSPPWPRSESAPARIINFPLLGWWHRDTGFGHSWLSGSLG